MSNDTSKSGKRFRFTSNRTMAKTRKSVFAFHYFTYPLRKKRTGGNPLLTKEKDFNSAKDILDVLNATYIEEKVTKDCREYTEYCHVYRVSIPDDKTVDDIRRVLQSRGIESAYGIGNVRPMAMGATPKDAINHGKIASEQRRKADIALKLEDERISRMNILGQIFGEKWASIQLLERPVWELLEQLSQEIHGMKLPDDWYTQSVFWLKALADWNSLPNRLERLIEEKRYSCDDFNSPEYKFWQESMFRFYSWNIAQSQKREVFDEVEYSPDEEEKLYQASQEYYRETSLLFMGENRIVPVPIPEKVKWNGSIHVRGDEIPIIPIIPITSAITPKKEIIGENEQHDSHVRTYLTYRPMTKTIFSRQNPYTVYSVFEGKFGKVLRGLITVG